MSVLVKGMKMPENCIKCPLQFGGWCYVSPPEIDERVAPTVDEAWEQGKPDWCPLVALPDKHGRLVDADAIVTAMNDMKVEGEVFVTAVNYVKLIMNDADTIVEAEGKE
jgi:hypothetical protein